MFTAPNTHPTTPNGIDDAVEAFCNTLVAGKKPVYLSLTSMDPSYRAKFCLNNSVDAATINPNYTVVFGWTIWSSYMSGTRIIEAEFHAVVQLANGNLLDVTPRVDGEDRVLFLPDSTRSATKVGNFWNTWSNERSAWAQQKIHPISSAKQIALPV